MLNKTSYLSNLTPLRGIAALLVVAFHFDNIIANLVNPAQSGFFEKCYLMVDLFFIMSGFIVYHVYGVKFQKFVKVADYKNFLIARFARIYPLHLFTLAVLIIVVFSSPIPKMGMYAPSAIIYNILLIHSMGFSPTFTWNIPSWSISAEWWAYVLFPLAVPFVHRNKIISGVVLSFLVGTIYYLLVFCLSPGKNLDITFNFGYLRGLAGFFLGVILYQVYEQKLLYKYMKLDAAFFSTIIFLLLTMHFNANDLVIIPGLILLVICTVCNDGFISNLFKSDKLQYLGNISYSIYLMQSIAMFIAFIVLTIAHVKLSRRSPLVNLVLWKSNLFFAGYLITLLLLSALTYAKIEKPARRWINKKWNRDKHVIEVAIQE